MEVVTMTAISSNCSVPYPRSLVISGIILLALLCFPVVVNSQQPTATIHSVDGEVLVSIQGKKAIAATVGTILRSGDIIETQAGTEVVLLLSEGSELRLGQNTKIDIAILQQQPESKARTSKLKLLYGKIRAILSPGHQEAGSSFTVETPNAVAGVKFSRPVIEVSYDPRTKTSLFKAYSVALTITNRSTKQIREVPQGSQAIVRNTSTLISPISKVAPPKENMIEQFRNVIRGATSTSAPISVGVDMGEFRGTITTETSTNPSPTRRDNVEQKRFRPVTLTIQEE
jgi:hypothetical protein